MIVSKMSPKFVADVSFNLYSGFTDQWLDRWTNLTFGHGNHEALPDTFH